MDTFPSLIQQAQAGDLDAYDQIVRQFQDMAVGYGYALLGDVHWAEDAAQEAFLQAFHDLPSLQEPAAFAGWLRRIVFKYCDRITRRRFVETVPLDRAKHISRSDGEPVCAVEAAELQAEVRTAIARLPENERIVTLLFYIGDYSQHEIAAFLEVPVTTVKKRLQTARKHLQQRMIAMVRDDLHAHAPSRDQQFAHRVKAAVDAVHTGDTPTLQALLDQEPTLANARSPDGRTLLNHLTDYPAHRPSCVEVARMLLHAGADVDARAIDPKTGETSLQWAVSSNDVAVAEILVDAGAAVNGIDGTGRPLAQALFYGQVEAAEMLVRRGAKVNFEFAAGLGNLDMVKHFFSADGGLQPDAGQHHPPVNTPILSPFENPDHELLEQAKERN